MGTMLPDKDNKKDGVSESLKCEVIKNFISGDVKVHEQIIHHDFVCIENDGSIVNRTDYLKAWANDYKNNRLKYPIVGGRV